MEITGKIFDILPAQKGTSSKGEWKKQEFIVETTDQYPKKICMMSWNDKPAVENLAKGSAVKVSFDVESREYNGKWYTDVKAWKIENLAAAKDAKPTIQAPSSADYPEELIADNSASFEDDLPF